MSIDFLSILFLECNLSIVSFIPVVDLIPIQLNLDPFTSRYVLKSWMIDCASEGFIRLLDTF